MIFEYKEDALRSIKDLCQILDENVAGLSERIEKLGNIASEASQVTRSVMEDHFNTMDRRFEALEVENQHLSAEVEHLGGSNKRIVDHLFVFEQKFAEKDRQLEEKERQIANLQASVAVLKKTVHDYDSVLTGLDCMSKVIVY